MKRLFGTKKEKAPPPSLDDAAGSVSHRTPIHVHTHWFVGSTRGDRTSHRVPPAFPV